MQRDLPAGRNAGARLTQAFARRMSGSGVSVFAVLPGVVDTEGMRGLGFPFSLAARLIEDGRVRLARVGQETRLDKPARPVKVGDGLVFAIGGRLHTVRIEALGVRRGPPAEARALYSPLDEASP